jgi:anti-sigma regulatory factor (Ser/Thr protein kinase)
VIEIPPVSAHKTFSFRREPNAVREARGALDDLNGDFPKARLYDASLCVSELVSNAIQHPGTGEKLELVVALDDDRLRVEVTDPGKGFEPGPPREGDQRGWGLFIVDSLADHWGVEAGDRTVVWFEIMRAPRDQLGQETTWTAGTSAPSS